VDIFNASIPGTAFFFALSLLFGLHLATSAYLAAFWLGSTGLTILSRLTLRYLLEKVRLRGRNIRNILAIGTNQRAFDFVRKVVARPELGYRLIGFVDEGREIPQEFKQPGYRLVADFDGFPRFLRENVVDEVVVSLPMRSLYDQASRMVALCEEQGITVRFLSNIFNNGIGESRVEQLEQDQFITFSTGGMRGAAMLVKRALDVSVSLVLLVVLAPLAAVVMLAIKRTSPGPAHFVQKRLGLNKRAFNLYKFRTMGADAEEKQAELEELNEVRGPVFKIKDDPRITRVGRFLRKTSLDELPQLFNVLKDDMSLVGPRPLPVRDYEGFDEDWHRRRFSVRPGITCLWQVGGRSDTSFDRWMELDMEYIDNWSLGLDLRILAQTIPAVIRGSGAV
jgi:exopolysaccharide biosynthesis polyprenyl glycosylphosphotransferase